MVKPNLGRRRGSPPGGDQTGKAQRAHRAGSRALPGKLSRRAPAGPPAARPGEGQATEHRGKTEIRTAKERSEGKGDGSGPLSYKESGYSHGTGREKKEIRTVSS